MIKVIVGEDMEQFKRGLDLAFGLQRKVEPKIKKVPRLKILSKKALNKLRCAAYKYLLP